MTAADVLQAPLALPGEKLKNRIAKAAMTEGLADRYGRPTPALFRLYQLWADGGAGLLITGNVAVDRAHLERPGNVRIEGELNGETRALFNQWSSAARLNGAGVWMQINHAGRQTPILVNKRPKAPSAIGVELPGKQFGLPEPLSEAEIVELIGRFVNAVVMARETGFTGAQIHAAHGYLISQFLSPRSNQRTDDWGGSLENRARFLLDIVRQARAKAGRDFTLSVKLNSADFQKGGFGAEDSAIVAGWLADAGVDVLEISGGTYEQPRMMNMDGLEKPDYSGLTPATAAREGYFLDFARTMREHVSIPLMVTGGFRSAFAMAHAIEEDGVSLIGIARPLVVDPSAPARLFAGAPEIERVEAKLRLGPGLLGPQSPIKAVKALNGFGAQYWQYQQLRRMGAGGWPDLKLSLLRAMTAEQRAQKDTLALME